ncbi:hypothetical protein GCM10028806_19660 [Spirosoma terrae]|uniref:Uncharacterized protein n=1 Tax=Spirosoma terrae TaxID=1968276 RepID=A0A6L9L5K5_9BACT|nr:sialate O-acetylesterase [Spirosoma terrae]NDU94717.1 hypothetical protein [Spirosoma terrae]
MLTNLSIQEPYLNAVYQRNNAGFASIPVMGTVAAGTDNVKASFSRIKVSDVQTLDYALPIVQTIPVDVNGNFAGTVQVPGGWYSLTVTAGDTTVLVSRVGAGEVFILFGHSFMQGGHDESHQLPATDERVITLLDDLSTRKYQFGKLTDKVGPFHDSPDAWGQFGDRLVQRLGVPVLLYGCAYGGSNILQNWQLLTGQPRTQLPPGTTDPASRQPFLPLETVMQYYVPKTGVRAILVEHGYNDRGTDTATFVDRFKTVFNYVRTTFNKPDLALVLVQEELTAVPHSLYDIPTAQGLQQLIQSYPNTWKGPDFNTEFWPSYHSSSGKDHLFGTAIDEFAIEWANSLTDSFFKQSTPYVSQGATSVFPAVLYKAPTAQLNGVDWAILLLAGLALVGLYIKRSSKLLWAFLVLALLALARLTGKV